MIITDLIYHILLLFFPYCYTFRENDEEKYLLGIANINRNSIYFLDGISPIPGYAPLYCE